MRNRKSNSNSVYRSAPFVRVGVYGRELRRTPTRHAAQCAGRGPRVTSECGPEPRLALNVECLKIRFRSVLATDKYKLQPNVQATTQLQIEYSQFSIPRRMIQSLLTTVGLGRATPVGTINYKLNKMCTDYSILSSLAKCRSPYSPTPSRLYYGTIERATAGRAVEATPTRATIPKAESGKASVQMQDGRVDVSFRSE